MKVPFDELSPATRAHERGIVSNRGPERRGEPTLYFGLITHQQQSHPTTSHNSTPPNT